MKKWRCAGVVFVFVAAFIFANTVQATMLLSFDSSDQSWVGQGQSFTIGPEDGYLFTGEVGTYDNSLSFMISSLDSPFGPDWNPASGEEYHYWRLDLAAPYDASLETGFYDNTARYAFQADSQAGLTFSGDHRGNNRNSGFFNVLEIAFDENGDLSRFAVDFTQYGEENPDWWIAGQLRFNSDIPLNASVPEPATFFLFSIGFGVIALAKIRKSSLEKK